VTFTGLYTLCFSDIFQILTVSHTCLIESEVAHILEQLLDLWTQAHSSQLASGSPSVCSLFTSGWPVDSFGDPNEQAHPVV
jgi:flagellin-specific chaperone FliS